MPTPTTFSVTNLYKKILNHAGTELERRPMLLRSISSLIYRTDGETTVEDALTALESDKADASSLATVATTGSYTDLFDRPILGTSAAKNTVDTYSANGTDPITGKGVADALDTLDVASVGGSGKYLTTISETDGKISATAATADTVVTEDSSNLVTSGAVYTAIGNLDVASVGGSGKYLTTISETDGKISATAATADTIVTSDQVNWLHLVLYIQL